MQNLSKVIQDTAKKLLEEKKVDLVVGFAKGSLPLRSTPYFARTVEEAGELIWNEYCENNLANYLRKREEKVAVVAKGCDVRAIVALMKENQIDREKLYIIGVPCQGMIDRGKASELVGGREILEAEINGEEVVLKGRGFEEKSSRKELLYDTCARCAYGNPVIYDELVGEEVPAKEVSFKEVEEFEALSAEERAEFLAKEMEKCIRCYACRNACPMCYCEECFVDSSRPQWISKRANSVKDNLIFQGVRVFHQLGRCADCGACERACPMGIKLSLLTRKGVKDVKEIFGYEAGLNPDDKPVLSDFSTEDPQPFLMKE
ncbi:Na+-translocating ferredoxin:NAD+ oxidoreductase RnfC subunit [Desulfohalotomaculum tongense]|uniref:4Fe-4S dicluster domain-containing protein n=1 Tax=Desulforadius tongensis TaxID=1216062 RepID=UPI00195AB4F5|nr:4Fe-4S dicluster domain-containing protein [Desulforadius tongensis]MBM7856201.1 Na+-translocating ferredoxin:NAD+ oxidoreductase RnfC subunit [Desulforadius tongensis]